MIDEVTCKTCDQTDGICGHTGTCRACSGKCLVCDAHEEENV